MKYFIILVVGAQALACGDRDPQPCTLLDHVEDNWLASAEESFIFLSNNWEKFVHAIPSVSKIDVVLQPFFNLCDSNGDFVVSFEEFKDE